MGAVIRCTSGPHAGRELPLRVDKPLQMEIRKHGEAAGAICIAREGGAWIFTNRSSVTSEVNDQAVERAELAHGDRIRVGKLELEAVLAAADPNKDETEPSLPALNGSPADDDPSTPPGLRIRAGAGSDGGTDDAGRPPTEEDLPAPPPVREVELQHPTEEDLAPASIGAARNNRRISASRLASVDTPERRQTLLHRVGQVFRRRGEQDGRLEALEDERYELLFACGRRALQEQGGIGLPRDVLARLSRGERVELAPEDLDQPALERYRRSRERLVFLDAEIAALRDELGLGPDAGQIPPQEMLLTEHLEHQDRAFRAMDGILTESLDEDFAGADDEGEDPVAGETPSGRFRRRRRRRR